jgi:hypothetical protein
MSAFARARWSSPWPRPGILFMPRRGPARPPLRTTTR